MKKLFTASWRALRHTFSQISKAATALTITALLLSAQFAWGADTYYLQSTTNAGTLTGEFYTTAPCTQAVTVSHDGVSYTKAVKFAGNVSSITSNNYPDRMIRYDCKTTKTDFTIVAYATGAKALYVGDIKEAAKGTANTVTAYTSITTTKNAVTTTTYSISSTTPASLFVSTGANSNVYIVQIIAVESGTPLPTAGSIGYAVNFNKTRAVARSGNAVTLDKTIEIHSNENVTAGSTAKIKMQTKGTNYIKFTTAAACTAKITINGIGNGFYVADDKSATTNATALQNDGSKTYEIEVGAGTHYIVPNGSNMYVEHLEFVATASCPTLTVGLGGDAATPAGGDALGSKLRTLTCTASSGTIASYQWKQNTSGTKTGAVNAEGDGATSDSFTPDPASAGTYYYYCVATDACGNTAETALSGAFTFKAAVACVAPTSVAISGEWARFVDENISLTATPTGHTGTPTYQWQKETAANVWTDISGATADTYTKNNCVQSDAGQYRCKVSTGTGCETISDPYKVRVYNLELYTPSTTYHNFTRVGTNDAGTLTLSLECNTSYNFKIHDGLEYYGNNGTISDNATNWVFSSTGTGLTNGTISTGCKGGTYTIRMEYGTGGNSSVANEPEISVTFPTTFATKTIYMVCASWWGNDNPKFWAHTYGACDYDVQLTAHPCEVGTFKAEIPECNNKVIFTRQDPSTSTIVWSGQTGYWNESTEITIGSNDKFTFAGTDGYNFTPSNYTSTPATITWNAQPANGSVGDTFTLNATCSDGSTVTYSVVPASAATISGTTATYAAAADPVHFVATATDACGNTVTANSNNFTIAAPSPLINYDINVGSSAGTTLLSSGTTTDATNITAITIDASNSGIAGVGAGTNRSAKLLIASSETNVDKYVDFKFNVACGKKLIPSQINIKVANVGSTSANKLTYKAEMSDGYGHTLSDTYIVTTQDGTLETFTINNSDPTKYFQGAVTLRLWAWKNTTTDNNGTGFRLGTPVEIYGAIENQATPNPTVTWNNAPANGSVGDTRELDLTYTDGSTLTLTCSPAGAVTFSGTTATFATANNAVTITATVTDACGNSATATCSSFKIEEAVVITPCFEMVADNTASSDASLANNESIAAGSKNCTTLTGGTAVYVYNNGTTAMTVSKVQNSGNCWGWYFGSSNNQIIITLDNPLKEGSIIDVSGYGGSGVGIKINGITTVTNTTGTTGGFTGTYTVPSGSALIGETTLTLIRATGSGVRLRSLTISNCQELCSDAPNGTGSTWTAAANTYEQNDAATQMSLTGVSATNGGTLSYQWYHSTSTDFSNAAKVEISGATSNTYTPSTAEAHDAWYYFCEVKQSGCTGTYVTPASGAIVVNGSAVTYTVTYNGNGSTGGTAPTDSNSPYASGATVTVLGNTGNLEKTGYDFNGWNTAANGSGTPYAAGATFSISANTTLYAQWEVVDPCHTYFWFDNDVDATSNSVTNNEDSFFSNVPASSGNGATGSIVIDGKTYNVTKRSSNTTPNISFTIPTGKTGVLYVIVQGSSSRYVQLKSGNEIVQQIQWENSAAGHSFDEIPAGTYTLTSSGNVGWCMAAVKVCDALPDADKFAIRVNNSAETAFTFAQCQTAVISLTGSQSGVSYQLYRDGSTTVGNPVAGTGSALQIASLTGNDLVAGVYTVKSVANATYAATAMNGSATFTIVDPTLTASSTSIYEGETATLAHPGDAATGSYASSDNTVATVADDGTVTGVRAGTATITFTGTGGCTATITITVNATPCFSVDNFKKPSSGWSDRSSGGEITSAMISGTIIGGTVVYSGTTTMGCNATYGLVFDDNTDEVTITLSGNTLPAGATVTIGARGADATTSHTCGFLVSGNTPTPATNTSSTKGNAFTQTYTIIANDGIAGNASFTLKRATTDKVYLESLLITGCEDKPQSQAIAADPSEATSSSLAWCEDYSAIAVQKVYKVGTPSVNYMTTRSSELSYKWMRYAIGADKSTAVSIGVTTSSYTPTANGNYYCVVTLNPVDSLPSTAETGVTTLNKVNRTLTITPSEPQTGKVPGNTVAFTSSVTDNGTAVSGITYSWTVDGEVVAASKNYTFTCPEVAASKTFTIALTVTKAETTGPCAGQTYTATQTTTVTVKPQTVTTDECITITKFETSQTTSPERYVYAWKNNQTDDANKLYVHATSSNSKGQSDDAVIRIDYNNSIDIYADASKGTFENVISVSFDYYFYNMSTSSTANSSMTVKVGGTTAGSAATSGNKGDAYKHVTVEVAGLSGYVTLFNANSGSSNTHIYIKNIEICTGSSCSDGTPTVSASSNVVCTGNPSTLTATGYTGSAALQWYRNNTAISGATSATYEATTAGTYKLVATGDCERTSNTITITVAATPTEATITPNTNQSIDLGGTVTFTADQTGVDYQWYVGTTTTFANAELQIGETNQTFTFVGDQQGVQYVFLEITLCNGTKIQSAGVKVTVNNSACYYITKSASISQSQPYTWSNGEDVIAEFYNGKNSSSSTSQSKTCGDATYTYSTQFPTFAFAGDVSRLVIYFQTGGTRTLNSLKVSTTSVADVYSNGTELVAGTDYTASATSFNSGACRTLTINFPTGHFLPEGTYLMLSFSSSVYISGFCVTMQRCTAPANADFKWSSNTATANYGAESNNLPTLTNTTGNNVEYSSSNTAVATIDHSTGAVEIVGVGTAKITATLLSDVNTALCVTEKTYTLTVNCNDGDPVPYIASDGSTVACSDAITMTVKQSSTLDYTAEQIAAMKVDWYRTTGGTRTLFRTINGSNTLTVEAEGTYDAVVLINCPMESSNKIVISSTNDQPSVKKLVPFQYFHVQKTDYETRVTSRMFRHLFYYHSAHAAATGVTPNKTSYQVDVFLHHGGNRTNMTSTAGWTSWIYTGENDTIMANYNTLYNANLGIMAGDTIYVKATPLDACGNLAEDYADSLAVFAISRDKNTIAYIVSGTKEGAFLGPDAGIPANNISDPVLTTHLPASGYIPTPVNGYAQFNILNYEPFDLVLLTDYPKNSAYAKRVNDLADLVDVKPILSFKVHMAGLSKWAAIGLTSEAKVPKPAITDISVVCYAHPMFADINDDLIDSDDKVHDPNSSVTTDSISVLAAWNDYHILKPITAAAKDGSVYKGIQGLNYDEVAGFVTIATGKNGSGEVVTCFERQNNIDARLLVLSINNLATKNINATGTAILDKMLLYLLDADPTHVSDCSIVFDNGGKQHRTGSGDHLWTNPHNWATNELPLPSNDVRIEAPCIVPDGCEAKCALMLIRTAPNDANTVGSITINPGGTLVASGNVRTVTNTFTTGAHQPVEDANLITIEQNATKAGTFVTMDGSEPKATLQLYSKAAGMTREIADEDKNNAVNWQYIAIPVNASVTADPQFRKAWMMKWTENQLSTEEHGARWQVIHNSTLLDPFEGYALTQEAAKTYTFNGNINLGDHDYDNLTYTNLSDVDPNGNSTGNWSGFNLIGNSYTAPIVISEMNEDNFGTNVDNTVYIFNTGTYNQWAGGNVNDASASNNTSAGNYVGIPVAAASYVGLNEVPSMQGFFVHVGSAVADPERFSVNYRNHVFGPVADASSAYVASPLRAPRHAQQQTAEVEEMHFDQFIQALLPIQVRTKQHADQLRLLVNTDCSHEFDNGWDARKLYGTQDVPQIVAIENDEVYSFNTVDDIDGQNIAVIAGNETSLSLRFDMQYAAKRYPVLYLHDMATGTVTDMYATDHYDYSVSKAGETRRFVISTDAKTRSTDDTNGLLRAWITDGTLFVENFTDSEGDFRIYDATGKLMQHSQLSALGRYSFNLTLIPGVYTIYVRTNTYVKPIKVIF